MLIIDSQPLPVLASIQKSGLTTELFLSSLTVAKQTRTLIFLVVLHPNTDLLVSQSKINGQSVQYCPLKTSIGFQTECCFVDITSSLHCILQTLGGQSREARLFSELVKMVGPGFLDKSGQYISGVIMCNRCCKNVGFAYSEIVQCTSFAKRFQVTRRVIIVIAIYKVTSSNLTAAEVQSRQHWLMYTAVKTCEKIFVVNQPRTEPGYDATVNFKRFELRIDSWSYLIKKKF